MAITCLKMIEELAKIFSILDEAVVDSAVAEIRAAHKIALYGVGREGLQMKGFAMRLYHLGLDAHVVGDMTTPPLAAGDLLIVSAGPGSFSTVAALMGVARKAGARTLVVTAQPDGACPRAADIVLPIPAPITANNSTPSGSVMPMGGSLYEGAQYILFEAMIVKIRDVLNVSHEDMRKNHTNLE